MLFRAIDFETTGIPAEGEEHAIVEIGWSDLLGGAVEHPTSVLCNPGRPIPWQASAVHHIIDADVAGHPPAAEGLARASDPLPDYWVAHNADYERQFFDGAGRPWICTYKVACRLWPDAPSHSLSNLRYFLGLVLDRPRAEPPHRAGPDAYVTAHLMARILEQKAASLDDMVRWSNGPALRHRIRFGKHKGEKWQDLPGDYLTWILDKSDLDREAKANARYWLRRRGMA